MRQAGRYMAEYRALRQKYTLLQLCRTPDLATEVTLQPLRRIEVDAAILFSDLLLPLDPMGIPFDFVNGEGPSIERPVRIGRRHRSRCSRSIRVKRWATRFDAIRQVKRELAGAVPLIGFAGAPFTLASYAIEGGHSNNFALTKALMYGDPGGLASLRRQAGDRRRRLPGRADRGRRRRGAGVRLVGRRAQRGRLPGVRAAPHAKDLSRASRARGVPTIHFGVGTGAILHEMREAGGDVIGADWRIPLDEAWERIGADRGIQGNLDPTLLLGPRERLFKGAADVLRARRRPARPHLQSRTRHPAVHSGRERAGAGALRPPSYRRDACVDSRRRSSAAAIQPELTGRSWRHRHRRRGIAGFSAAWELRRGSPLVLEQRRAPGGVILTEHVDGFVIDAGPDALLVQKPAAIDLCRELGLGDRLFPTLAAAHGLRRCAAAARAAARSIGAGHSDAASRRFSRRALFSWPGKLRMALELSSSAHARRRGRVDRQLHAPPVRREAVTYLAEPLLAGIHAGDVDRLSMRALVPAAGRRRTHARQRAARVCRRRHARAAPRPVRRRFHVAARRASRSSWTRSSHRLPAATIRYGVDGRSIERIRAVSRSRCARDELIDARAVIVAVSRVGRGADAGVDRCGADRSHLREIPYASSATVAIALAPRTDPPPAGRDRDSSCRAPSGATLMAASWVSSKWPHRAPAGRVLLRGFVGGAYDPAMLDAERRRDLRGAVFGELAARLEHHRRAALHARVPLAARECRSTKSDICSAWREIDQRLADAPGLVCHRQRVPRHRASPTASPTAAQPAREAGAITWLKR